MSRKGTTLCGRSFRSKCLGTMALLICELANCLLCPILYSSAKEGYPKKTAEERERSKRRDWWDCQRKRSNLWYLSSRGRNLPCPFLHAASRKMTQLCTWHVCVCVCVIEIAGADGTALWTVFNIEYLFYIDASSTRLLISNFGACVQ